MNIPLPQLEDYINEGRKTINVEAFTNDVIVYLKQSEYLAEALSIYPDIDREYKRYANSIVVLEVLIASQIRYPWLKDVSAALTVGGYKTTLDELEKFNLEGEEE